ncbi:carboxylesterase 3 [Rhynchocyon petersi]
MGMGVRARSRVPAWIVCLLLAFHGVTTEHGTTHPEVDTPLGRVRGRQVDVKGTDRRVNVFLGIPFAQAPLGPRRFSAPHPAQPWEGVRDASKAPVMCLQNVERMDNFRFVLNGKHQIFPISEDCLVLNIYSPAGATTGAGKPVMVWIHGGSMLIGSATSHDGSALAALGDVVVVTVQYRLGILGFLSTGDEHAPGNWAFLDLVASLRWVQDNITPFGGDPNCVTIFGSSAGALMVSGLVLSPLTERLFHRAIVQSGVITISGILDSEPLALAQDFADSLGCGSPSVAEMLQCLRQKTSEEMILTKDSRQIMPHTVDGTFFPKSPRQLLRDKEVHPVPFLIGINNHEISWLIPRGWGILDKIEQMDHEDILNHLKYLIQEMHHSRDVTVAGNFEEENTEPQRDSGCPVFFYEFQHRPSSFAKIKPDWVKADHGAELAFMFGGPFLTDESTLLAFPEATEEEKQLSLTMIAQWTHFARTGDPNGQGLPSWPLFNQSEQYLEISFTPQVGQKVRGPWMKFWAETLPNKIQQWKQKQTGRKAQEEL